jgi:hypothetical protein
VTTAPAAMRVVIDALHTLRSVARVTGGRQGKQAKSEMSVSRSR